MARDRSDAGTDRLTQLVPADEVKADDAGATYSAAITVQELPKSPVWADATERDMVQYAMLYDSADPTTAVSMKVDGSAAVGFGLGSKRPDDERLHGERREPFGINGNQDESDRRLDLRSGGRSDDRQHMVLGLNNPAVVCYHRRLRSEA